MGYREEEHHRRAHRAKAESAYRFHLPHRPVMENQNITPNSAAVNRRCQMEKTR